MKKIIVMMLVAYGGYLHFSSPSSSGSFDEAGNPITVLFSIDNCPPCDNARNYLKRRKVTFQEYNINSGGEEAKAKLYEVGGGQQFPYLVSGNQSATVFSKQGYTGLFAQVFGSEFLTPSERHVLKENFDASGQARLVMYSSTTCGYCTKAREYLVENNVPFTELFIDRDAKAKRYYELLEAHGTPLIYIGYRRIDGFNKPLLAATIKSQLDS